MTKEIATFGAGCFWCIESAFNRLNGVKGVISGYSGGETDNPDYQSVCTGQTGHAEVVQITFDNEIIQYSTLLTVLFSLHDPTQLNRQGEDIGTQYRSVIFYHSEDQKNTAQFFIQTLKEEKVFDAPIVTLIEPAAPFYPAENYHQDYVTNNPRNSYCMMVVTPKLEKFKLQFQDRLKSEFSIDP